MTRKPATVSLLTTAALFATLTAFDARAGQTPTPQIDITGAWIFDVTTDAGTSRPMIIFSQQGEKVTGSYASQTLGEADLAGTLKGQDLVFTFMADMQGMSVPVRYEATVSSSDAMSGSLNIDMVGRGTFTGRLVHFRQESEPLIPFTAAGDAAQMFQTYCSACHGKSGKGDGPAAKALRTPPRDLTRLTADNRGTFPTIKVRQYIEGIVEIPSHGARDMPIWGGLFVGLDHDPATKTLRIDKLTEFLQSIQK